MLGFLIKNYYNNYKHQYNGSLIAITKINSYNQSNLINQLLMAIHNDMILNTFDVALYMHICDVLAS
jgi:hypothetical protein